MTNEELRKKINDQLKTMDRITLKMIHVMIKEFSMPIEEDDELFRELERISKNHRSGKSPSFTVAEAIEYVRKNRKNTRGIVPLSKANEAELEKRRKEYKAGKGASYSVTEAKIELRRRISKK